MNVWDILGIQPTGEIAAIKKAYAEQLKKHHPEDDPAGFQQLREAYELALKIAKRMQRILSEIPEKTENQGMEQPPLTLGEINPTRVGNEAHPFLPSRFQPYETVVPEVCNLQEAKEQFMHRVAQLYDDFFARIELVNWKALFDCELIRHINSRNELSIELLAFLAGHHHLPPEVWKFMDEYFRWSQQKENYDSLVSAEQIEAITQRIKSPINPCYSRLKRIEGFDYERFITSRETALLTSKEDIFMEAIRDYITHGKEVYPDDRELPGLLGRYYWKIRDFQQAKVYLVKALPLDPANETLRTLLEQVNQAIKIELGQELLKQPWRKDIIEQYYGITREISAQKKAKRQRLRWSREIMFGEKKPALGIAGFLVIMSLVTGFIISWTGKIQPNPPQKSEPVVVNTIPIELNETNIDQIPASQRVMVRFDNIIDLQIKSMELPDINKDSVPERIFINDSELSYTGVKLSRGGSSCLKDTRPRRTEFARNSILLRLTVVADRSFKK
jgi:tetratricopeptide (TPR) repeat protein